MTNTALINRNIKIGDYQFDEAKHLHTLKGKPLTGVTTVLSVIAKPALIQWSANEAVKFIETNFPSAEDIFKNPNAISELLAEAKYAHRKKKESAGDWGSVIHDSIEKWIKDSVEPVLEDNQEKAFNHFKQWTEENGVKFLESEKHVFSKEHWIGGICDLVIEKGGKKYIADIKTSSGIYPEAFFQMGAYHLCLEEMGQSDFEGYIVINLTKKGTIEVQENYDTEGNQNAFKAALTLFRQLKAIS